MRTQTEAGLNPGRIGAFIAMIMIAALIAIGTNGPRPAAAAGCTFRLVADGVSGADYTATEGEGVGGGFDIVIEKLTPNCTGGVNITFTPGTATSPGDYTDPGTIGVLFTNPSGTLQTVNFFPTDDATVGEGSETFTVNLTAQAGDLTTPPTSQVLTIIDNDGPPVFSFSAANYPVAEQAGSVQITVNRSGATGVPVSVQYSTSNGTAGAGDYTAIVPTTLNFLAADTSKTFNVSITNDVDPENSETINLILSTPSNGGSVGANSTVTIADNDGPGTVQFSQTNYSASEGTTGQFSVSRINGNTGSVSATCGTVQNGSATATTDYAVTPNGGGILTWGPGDTATKICEVPIAPDADAGNGETFGLTLTSPNLGSPASATVTINDASGSGTLQFTAASYTGTENGGPITVTVTRLNGSTGTVTVDLATTTVGSTATAGVDYTATSTTLTFVAGDITESWTISPIDDAIIEGTESVNVVLTNAAGGAVIGSPNTVPVNISDNESPLPQISSITPGSGAIGGGTGVTITGINFTGVTLVTFGGFACTSLVPVSSTTITCVTPAHGGGVVDVLVTTPAGTSSPTGAANDFFYTGGPTITALNPATGPASGSTIVTITGTNFTSSGLVVKFDGVTAVHSFVDTTQVVAVAPPHSAGTVNVSITTPGGTSPNTLADDFTYTGASLPIVTSLSPTSGPVGTTVIITGSGFSGASLVSFGGVSSVYTVNSDAQITATVPAGTPIGTVDIRVTTASGTSSNTSNDNFNNTSSGALVTYSLFFRFTLIVWIGPNNISALAALRGLESPDNPSTNNVQALVGAIWRFDASTQTFKGYFPGSDGIPGANDFTTLTNGVGYFVALLNPGTVTWVTLGAN